MEKKHLVWGIIKIAREHRKTVEKRISALGIHPSQHHFLMHIAKNGSCTQNSIAEAMEVSAKLFLNPMRENSFPVMHP